MSEDEILKDIDNYISFANKSENFSDINEYLHCKELARRMKGLLDLYNKEKEKNKELFEEYNKRVGTIIKYEQAIKSFFDGTNITDIEPWTIYKIKGELLFELEELLED